MWATILVVTIMTRIVLGSMLCAIFLHMITASIVVGKTARMAVLMTTTVPPHIQSVVMVTVELIDVDVKLTVTVRRDRSVTRQILMETGTNMSVSTIMVVTTMTRNVLGSIPLAKLTSQHMSIRNASIVLGRTANLAVLMTQCVPLASPSVATVAVTTTVDVTLTLTVLMSLARIIAINKITSARPAKGNSHWTPSNCTVSPVLGAPRKEWLSLSWVRSLASMYLVYLAPLVYSTIRELPTSREVLLSSTDGKIIMRMIMNGKLWEVVIRWV